MMLGNFASYEVFFLVNAESPLTFSEKDKRDKSTANCFDSEHSL